MSTYVIINCLSAKTSSLFIDRYNIAVGYAVSISKHIDVSERMLNFYLHTLHSKCVTKIVRTFYRSPGTSGHQRVDKRLRLKKNHELSN